MDNLAAGAPGAIHIVLQSKGGVGLRFLGATADAGQLQGLVTADLAMNLLEAEYRLGRRSTAVAWPAGGGSLPLGTGVAAPAKLLGLATWHRHKGPCEHVKRLEAETNASRADYHRGVSGKIRSLAQAVEGALTDRERSCCSGGVYQDRPRHTSRRVLIGT